MKIIFSRGHLVASLLLVFWVSISASLHAQIWPDNENFEQEPERSISQVGSHRYEVVLKGQSEDKQLVFIQSTPHQSPGTKWGYVGQPGAYFNNYPNQAFVYNYDKSVDGSPNPRAGGYGIYRMLFSKAPFAVSGQQTDTLHKLGNFKLKSIYVALGKNYGTTVPNHVRDSVGVNFHALRNGVAFTRPWIAFGGKNHMGAGDIYDGKDIILRYSAIDQYGGRTVTFFSDHWASIDGLWISTGGTAKLPVLVDNIVFEEPETPPPTEHVTELSVEGIKPDEVTLNWSRKLSASIEDMGDRRLVLVKETDNASALPPLSIFTARPDEFPAAIPRSDNNPRNTGLTTTYGKAETDLGDGWYCVYNDVYSGFPLKINGLSSMKRYRVVVVEYNGSRGFQTFMANAVTEDENAIAFATPSIPPILTPSVGNAQFTNWTAQTVIDPGITVMDPDSDVLASGSIAITEGFLEGSDVLSFENNEVTMGNIAGSYDGQTGVLTLISNGATAELSDWQTALQAVTFHTSTPEAGQQTRTISFTVNDGYVPSDVAEKKMDVVYINRAPTDIQLSNYAVNQSAGTMGLVGEFVTADLDEDDVHTYTLVAGDGDEDNAYFSISDSRLEANDAAAMEPRNYNIRVQAKDIGQLYTQESFVITVTDDIAPAVTAVNVPDDKTYVEGEALDFEVLFSEVVVVNSASGTPAIPITIGGENRYAYYVSGVGTPALAFTYRVQNGDEDTDGISLGTDIELNTGTIQDAAGNDIITQLNSIAPTDGIRIDAVAPLQPTGVTVVSGDGEASLSWQANKENDLDGYRIYGGDAANPTTLISTVDAESTVYTATDLTNGIRYFFHITAVDEVGNEGPVSAAVDIVPMAQQTILFEPLDAATYGEADLTLTAASTSGLPVAFSSNKVDVAETFQDAADGNNWKLRIHQAGEVTITASQPGNPAFLPAQDVDQVLTIDKAQPSVTVPPVQTHVYDGTPKQVSATASPEELSGQLQYSPQGTFTNVGEHRVRVYLNENSNYLAAEAYTDFSITPASQQGLHLPDLTVDYDGNPHRLDAVGLPLDAAVSYTIKGNPGNAATDAGSYEVVATVSRPNHTDEVLRGTLYINKAKPSITALANQRHTYDGNSKNVQATVNHDEATLAFSPGASYTSTGTYKVLVSVPETPNYHAASVEVTLVIEPAAQQGLRLSERTVTYTGQAHVLEVSGLVADAKVSYTIDGIPGNSATNAGMYEVKARVSRPHYADTLLESTLFIERAAAYLLGEENQIHTYDGKPKALDVSLSHDETEVSYSPRAAFTEAGTYTVTVSARQTANYHGVNKTFTLRIDRADRSISFQRLTDRTYGDTEFNPGATTSSGEAISYTSSNTSVAEVTAGGFIRIVGAGEATITAIVPENANYTSRPSTSQTLVIAKAKQTITLSAPPEVTRDAGVVPITATSSSGLPVSLEIDDPEVATLDGTDLHIHRLGTVRITATQGGDANHEPAQRQTVTVRVSDPVADLPIRVNKAVSPNGDGINEYLVIEAIKDHPDNRVSISNRNGTVVWEASGYNNGTVAFRGEGTGRNRIPAGTYFYVAEINVNGKWEYDKGWFVLRY